MDIIIISSKCNLFSLWYRWKATPLALNNNHSHTFNPNWFFVYDTHTDWSDDFLSKDVYIVHIWLWNLYFSRSVCVFTTLRLSPWYILKDFIYIFFFQTRKVIKFADAVVVQGYNIYIKSLGMTRYVLTTHGRFDNIQVQCEKKMY